MAAAARAWAAALGVALDLPVTLRDERLSSFEAERRVGRDAARADPADLQRRRNEPRTASELIARRQASSCRTSSTRA